MYGKKNSDFEKNVLSGKGRQSLRFSVLKNCSMYRCGIGRVLGKNEIL